MDMLLQVDGNYPFIFQGAVHECKVYVRLNQKSTNVMCFHAYSTSRSQMKPTNKVRPDGPVWKYHEKLLHKLPFYSFRVTTESSKWASSTVT